MTVRQRHLVIAAVLVVATGAVLGALAWWLLHDRGGTDLWLVGAVRGIVAVVLSKAGLKAGLATVIAVVGAVTWVRSRRASAERGAGQLTDAGR